MLSLSSINGLVWFYPDKINPLYPENGIYVDDLQVNGKQIDLSKNAVLLDPDFENLSLTVSSPYFGNPENQNIQYRVTGLNNNWQSLPANGTIDVGRSPSGQYTIVVRSVSQK